MSEETANAGELSRGSNFVGACRQPSHPVVPSIVPEQPRIVISKENMQVSAGQGRDWSPCQSERVIGWGRLPELGVSSAQFHRLPHAAASESNPRRA